MHTLNIYRNLNVDYYFCSVFFIFNLVFFFLFFLFQINKTNTMHEAEVFKSVVHNIL